MPPVAPQGISVYGWVADKEYKIGVDDMDDYVTKGEYEATISRLDAEDKRENERLKVLDADLKEINQLTVSVNKLAVNMESMLKEQTKQGERLEALESRDGEMWRKVTGYIATAVIGIVIGFVFTQIGM